MLSNSLLSPPSPFHSLPQIHTNSNNNQLKLASTSHYNSIIKAHIDSNQPRQAFFYFTSLISHPYLLPDSFTFPLILKACSHLSSLKETQQVHSFLLKTHFSNNHDIYSCTSLMNAYASCENIHDAHKLFDTMPERNTVIWNSMINAFLKCRDFPKAFSLFNEMEDKNVVSWNSIIGACVQANMPNEALMFFIQMQDSSLNPDYTTIVSITSAISDTGLLHLAKKVHGYIVRHEFSLSGPLGVALITMYSKCGIINSAHKLFLTIPIKNVAHWTSIITETANHGLAKSSLQLFSQMINSSIKPNHITFIGVLNACRHVGNVEEGMKYFNLMKSYDIEPQIEHYGCVVDLLGRCGRVEEGMKIACALSVDNGVIWSTLLASCEKYGNVELGEVVASKMIGVEPRNGSGYIMLSNLYGKVGDWEKRREMRKRMEEEKARKVAGVSRVEVDGRVHEFVAGDGRRKVVYGVLEGLTMNMRVDGCELEGSVFV